VDIGNSPNSLNVVATTNTAIIVGWSAPNAGKVTKYHIWRATGPITKINQPTQIGSTDGATFTFTDSTAKKGQHIQYTYIVTATVQGKESGPSNFLVACF
jgi:hypothetical protein